MKYSEFLPSMIDQLLRKELCGHFRKANVNARIFFENPHGFIEIRCVEETNDPRKADWVVVGPIGSQWSFIKIYPDRNNLGVIFHEVFHSTFHESPSYKIMSNQNWGDALCDAFRYFMEGKYIHCAKSYFFNEIMDWIKRDDYNDSQIKKLKKEDVDYNKNDLNYRYLPSRIIRKSIYNYDTFKDIWKVLNSSNIVFDNYFLGINYKVHEVIP